MDKNRGFTLIEFMVVISVVFLFLGTILPRYNDFASQTKLRSEASKVLDIFELAKKKAISADLFDKNCTNFTGYRTTVAVSNYSLKFCCNSICSTVQNFNLSTNVTFITGIGDFNFTPLMINPNFISNTIQIKSSIINKCINISVSPIGVLELNETLISC
ncbi:conserved hypothetical protein [Candidatus Roizmanbacteria bacterium]|nr:conserved hypothetical protein [Candidatus Roizmanbacteria bacterium]